MTEQARRPHQLTAAEVAELERAGWTVEHAGTGYGDGPRVPYALHSPAPERRKTFDADEALRRERGEA